MNIGFGSLFLNQLKLLWTESVLPLPPSGSFQGGDTPLRYAVQPYQTEASSSVHHDSRSCLHLPDLFLSRDMSRVNRRCDYAQSKASTPTNHPHCLLEQRSSRRREDVATASSLLSRDLKWKGWPSLLFEVSACQMLSALLPTSRLRQSLIFTSKPRLPPPSHQTAPAASR